MRFLVRCETPAHVLKTQFAFFRYGFFFLKGFTVVFHRKKLFRFCFNYVFFLKGFTLFFPHKKSFFVYFLITFFFSSKNLHIFPHKKSFFVFFFKIIWVKLVHRDVTSYCPQKVTKSCSKTIAHICFSFPPFRGAQMEKICLKTAAHVLKTHVHHMGGVL